MPNLSQSAMDDIDPFEDDVGYEDDDFDFGPKPGAKGAASSAAQTGKSVMRVGNTVSQQALGRFGNVAMGANFAATGSAFTAASTGVSAALAPIAAVTGPVGLALALVESAFSAASAVSTYGHIKNLEKILVALGPGAMPGTCDAILFCCKKKNKKLKRKGLGCIPVFGSICNSVYTLGRTIQKSYQGTKGKERRKQASTLWVNTLNGDKCAIAACKEILGVKVYDLIKGCSDGDLVLKKKMKSL